MNSHIEIEADNEENERKTVEKEEEDVENRSNLSSEKDELKLSDR